MILDQDRFVADEIEVVESTCVISRGGMKGFSTT
jgi:hypothetical protein